MVVSSVQMTSLKSSFTCSFAHLSHFSTLICRSSWQYLVLLYVHPSFRLALLIVAKDAVWDPDALSSSCSPVAVVSSLSLIHFSIRSIFEESLKFGPDLCKGMMEEVSFRCFLSLHTVTWEADIPSFLSNVTI